MAAQRQEEVMDDTRFDAWTRRRFGLATGGGIAALLGLAASEVAEAKKNKKKRKKRCRKLGRGCNPGGKRKCCGKLKCDRISFEPSPKTRCCRKAGQPCGDDLDCCENLCCPLPVGVCSAQCESDRNVKANFGSVDAADMLRRVQDLPISTWNYTADDPAIRHIGPMAQDFAALFGVGADDRRIHPLDGQGVALAAIQSLLGELEALRAANARLAMRVAALERRARGA
jgi:hypothetical protein